MHKIFFKKSQQNICYVRYKTNTKSVAVSDIPNNKVCVAVFDFKNMLSLLHDKDLMNPSNLVLTNSPGKTQNVNKNDIFEINESD